MREYGRTRRRPPSRSRVASIPAMPARWRGDDPSPLSHDATASSPVSVVNFAPDSLSTQVPTAELGFAPLQTAALRASVFLAVSRAFST